MKLALPVFCVLGAALLMGTHGEPIGRTITNVIQGGQTMANMMMVSGARAVAPLVDTFIQMTQRFMSVGKRHMQHLDSMLTHMDVDPQMKVMAEAMHMNLYDIETALDGLMQNTVWGGQVVKATADCVVPQYEAVTRVKDNAMRAIGTILQDHRNALLGLSSAGSNIGDQLKNLQDMEDKVTMMIANGQGLEAMQYVLKNRQKTEKDGRVMESVYFGALDEYREATGAALKKMSDSMGKVYEEGDKIMEKLDTCIEPKIMKMLKSEMLQKKNKINKHVLPDHLHFVHDNLKKVIATPPTPTKHPEIVPSVATDQTTKPAV